MSEPARPLQPAVQSPAQEQRPRFSPRPPSPLQPYYSLRDRLTLEVTKRCEEELGKVLAGRRITEGDKLVLIACLRGIMCVNSPGQALKSLQQYHELRDEILDRLDVRDHGIRLREREKREADERERERRSSTPTALM